MTAKQIFPIGIDQKLDPALTSIVLGQITAAVVHGQRHLLVFDALVLAGLLGFADKSHFRICINNRRHGLVAHEIFLAQNSVNRHLGFAICRMGQHPDTVDIADRKHSGNIGSALSIRDNPSAFNQHSEIFQPETTDYRPTADAKQGVIGVHGSGFTRIGKFNRAGFDIGHLTIQVKLDAFPLVVFL